MSKWKPNFAFGMYPTEKMWICSKCGEQSNERSRYCPNCGEKIKEPKNAPIIDIDGKKYIAEAPQLKTLHKDGEVVIGGFRALDEYELCWQMGAKDESLNCDVCPHSCKEVKSGEE